MDPRRNPWSIRAAELADADGLCALTAAVAAEGRYIVPDRLFFTPDQQRAVLERRDPHFHEVLVAVASESGRVVGELEVVRGLWSKNRHTATLAMVVAPDWRSHGIGSRLLVHLEDWARAEGVLKLCLSVFASNDGAMRLYERTGYAKEAIRPRQFRSAEGFVDEILMAKFLAE